MPAQPKVSKGNILSIDIGGTNLKACLLDPSGKMLTEFIKTPTPKKSSPKAVLEGIKALTKELKDFEKISIGFPGYVKLGIVQTAPNLAENKWANVDLAQQVANLFGKPVRLINDADQQGLGIVSGEGLEIVFTLGTGFGTSILFDGELLPHLELAHLPVNKKEDYDDFIGDRGFEKVGKKKWNKRLKYIIEIYKTVFNYDKLYIGGGNSNEINFELEKNISLVSNKDGIKGGAKLWLAKEKYHIHTTYPEQP
jgi:polyphosphate glucokinase